MKMAQIELVSSFLLKYLYLLMFARNNSDVKELNKSCRLPLKGTELKTFELDILNPDRLI